MRLATARDEIEPLRDRTIDGPDDPYLTILVLARVVTELGSVPQIGVEEIEGLFAADLAFLQDLYGIINFGDQADVEALQASVLPDEVITDVIANDGADEEPVVDGEAAGADASEADGDAEDSESTEEPARPRRARIEEVVSSARD